MDCIRTVYGPNGSSSLVYGFYALFMVLYTSTWTVYTLYINCMGPRGLYVDCMGYAWAGYGCIRLCLSCMDCIWACSRRSLCRCSAPWVLASPPHRRLEERELQTRQPLRFSWPSWLRAPWPKIVSGLLRACVRKTRVSKRARARTACSFASLFRPRDARCFFWLPLRLFLSRK